MRALLLVPLALAACSTDAPQPADVRAAIETDLGHVLREARAASDASTQALPDLAFATMMPVAVPAFDPAATTRWLDDQVFTDQNYLGDGTYRFPAELACTPVAPATTSDPACVARVNAAEPRIRVARADTDQLAFAIELGADHEEPIQLVLAHDTVTLTVDLDGANGAMVALARALGIPIGGAQVAGQLTAQLAVVGPAHVRAALSIDRPLAIALAGDGIPLDDPAATRFASAQGPIAALELDGAASRIVARLALGDTVLHLPATAIDAATDIELPGATADVSFDGRALLVANLSLGDRTTTVRKGGVQARAIDLDPEDGRAVDVAIAADQATGLETIAVSPRFDLRTVTDHAVLGDVPPAYDITRVVLLGSVATDGAGMYSVLTGSLSVATDPVAYGFTAIAGQCVTGMMLSACR